MSTDNFTVYLEGLPISAEEQKINDLTKEKAEMKKLLNMGKITYKEYSAFVGEIKKKKQELETL